MGERVCVCVDAMGGDEPPETVLEGVAAALASDPGLEVLVAGDGGVVRAFEEAHERAKALVTTEVIGMAEHPAEAVRAKRDSSIVRGCAAVKAGEAAGFFSAGSTGAVLAAATFGIGRLRGIKRPAIAVVVPGASGRYTVVLDVGANADVKPEYLAQFAEMGRAYSTVVLGVADPAVALLSNGSEDTKGNALTIAEHAALRKASGDDGWFVGNAEGNDLLAGRFDVVVCDGFTGNVALKTFEGTAKYLLGEVRKAAKGSKRAAVGAALVKPALKEVAGRLSGDEQGGAILLGLRAPVLIGHGATSVEAVKNGTLATAATVRGELVNKIAAHVAPAA